MSSGYLSAANMFINKIIVNGVIYNSATTSEWYDRDYYKVKLYSALSDITVANSHAGLRAYKASPKNSVCIYNGIDLSRFEKLKPAKDVELELLKEPKGDRYIVTMVAAFEYRKDYHTLIKAAVKLCSKNKKAIFLLVGDGSTRELIRKEVPAELLDKQILFLGLRDDIESILQITDIGVLSSAPVEGLSNSIIEYMAAGKPVVATKGGGTDELVKDGETGFLTEPKNSDQLAEKIEFLMQQPGLATAMGAKGRKWVVENLDARQMTTSYINLYTKLLNKTRIDATTALIDN
jgi:glycosyltransferase involved in cell wall biosynthesis